MGALALLGKLWSYAVNFFAKLYGAKIADAEAKYADASQRACALKKQLDFAVLLHAELSGQNEKLQAECASYEQQLKDAKAHIQTLQEVHEKAKIHIAGMPSDDAWDARIGANVTPPIGGGGNA